VFKVTAKFTPEQAMKNQRGRRGTALYFNLGAKQGWTVNATPGPLYPPPRKRDLVTTVQKAGWAPGPVWTGAENLALHRD